MATEAFDWASLGGRPSKKKATSSWLDKAGNAADYFNKAVESTRLPQFAGGLLQGTGDIGASLANIIARPLGHPISHPELQKYIPQDIGSQMAVGGGELASQIPLMTSGAGLIGKLTGFGTKSGLSGKAAQGALSGALMGENNEGEGRLSGAIEGAAIPTTMGIAKNLTGLRSKNIAEKVMQGMKESKAEYAKKFGNIFKETESRGIANKVKPIDANERLLNRAGNKDYLYALEQYNKKPSIEKAHEAQSQLGKYIKDIGSPKSTLDRHAKEEAKKVSKGLREHIAHQMQKTGNTDLALKYNEARKGYSQEVAPYLNSKAIKKFLNDELRPNKLASFLGKEEKFMSKLGQYRHPEIQQREMIKNILNSKIGQYGIGTGLGGLGLYGLSKAFK